MASQSIPIPAGVMADAGDDVVKPSLTSRVAARSLPAIVAAIEGHVSRLGARRSLSFRGRKYSIEAFVNAVLIEAVRMPDERLDELLARGTDAYEAMIAGAKLPAPDTSTSVPVIGSSSDDPSSRVGDPKRRKSRGG